MYHGICSLLSWPPNLNPDGYLPSFIATCRHLDQRYREDCKAEYLPDTVVLIGSWIPAGYSAVLFSVSAVCDIYYLNNFLQRAKNLLCGVNNLLYKVNTSST